MANPTIQELRESEKYELIAQLHHNEIKQFVLDKLSDGGKMVKYFMYYQVVMILFGMFFFIRSIVFAFKGSWQPLWFSLAALIFSFSALILIHELLHAIAIKFTGAKKINFGGYFKKFIFYAEADQHVLNRNQFAFIALTPLVAVKIITLTGIVLYINHPAIYLFIFIMSAHSLFCAGDIGLLSIFYREKNSEIFTYDVKEEKTSYYYRKVD